MEKIKNIGLTNFDTFHLADLVEEGAPIVSNQVSHLEIIDRCNSVVSRLILIYFNYLTCTSELYCFHS
jgi:diketogulonate reductase-like aldo/keto reductase